MIEIMADIHGYLILIFILLWGFSMAFAVSMPENEAFENGVWICDQDIMNIMVRTLAMGVCVTMLDERAWCVSRY